MEGSRQASNKRAPRPLASDSARRGLGDVRDGVRGDGARVRSGRGWKRTRSFRCRCRSRGGGITSLLPLPRPSHRRGPVCWRDRGGRWCCDGRPLQQQSLSGTPIHAGGGEAEPGGPVAVHTDTKGGRVRWANVCFPTLGTKSQTRGKAVAPVTGQVTWLSTAVAVSNLRSRPTQRRQWRQETPEPVAAPPPRCSVVLTSHLSPAVLPRGVMG